jgi:hypothetical protein
VRSENKALLLLLLLLLRTSNKVLLLTKSTTMPECPNQHFEQQYDRVVTSFLVEVEICMA